MVSVTQTGVCPVPWPHILAKAMYGRQKFLKERCDHTAILWRFFRMKNHLCFRVIFITIQPLAFETFCHIFPIQIFKQNYPGHLQRCLQDTGEDPGAICVDRVLKAAQLPQKTPWSPFILQCTWLEVSAGWVVGEWTQTVHCYSGRRQWSVSSQRWDLEKRVTCPLYPTSAVSPGIWMARKSSQHSWGQLENSHPGGNTYPFP